MPKAGSRPRAPRLAVRVPVALRTSPRGRWYHGWTINLSQSGVLFALQSAPRSARDVEFVIKLSADALDRLGLTVFPDLHCHGRVVRMGIGPTGVALAAADIRKQTVRASRARKTSMAKGTRK